MRGILGTGPSDIDLARALHLAKNDVNLAFNILYDSLGYKEAEVCVKRTTAGSGVRISNSCNTEAMSTPLSSENGGQLANVLDTQCDESKVKAELKTSDINESGNTSIPKADLGSTTNGTADSISSYTRNTKRATHASVTELSMQPSTLEHRSNVQKPVHLDAFEEELYYDFDIRHGRLKWSFVGEAEVMCYSTCKGSKLKAGDEVLFSFPKRDDATMRASFAAFGGRGALAAQQIVRFSTKASGDIGRLPADWAKCLIPLISGGKVKARGICRAAPEVLTTMDTILLNVRLYVSSILFGKTSNNFSEMPTSMYDVTIHPLPLLFRLLGKKPFIKAEYTPEDLNERKRAFYNKDTVLPANKRIRLSSNGDKSSAQVDEVLSDSDLNRLVGTTESYDLKEMDTPSKLLCELRSYQKQALHWMTYMESGQAAEQASKTLHPCWDAFHLSDKDTTPVYVNAFSGEATMDFPNALKLSKGGILADAMGLGKTVMTIALILSNPGRGSCPKIAVLDAAEGKGLRKNKKKGPAASQRKAGGTLIVCPMTLLGQWKSEIETHSKEALAVYSHYGPARVKDVNAFLNYDVVITTYGIISSEYQSGGGPLHSIQWFRVVLDEAHTIKASKSQSAQAIFNISADIRWCLTGTPIQNKLEDAFSLLHFLQVEPWCNWGWWNKLVQKPFEDGDERGLFLLKAILRPLMLRRTKDTLDKSGRPILELPPCETEVVECEFSEAERDFYDALYKRSKVKFDQFVEQGKVLHNYASILELLLRMRQCCDHPFLVLSRGDTEEFSDLGKLARRFLDGGTPKTENERNIQVSRAYVEEVVDDIRKGNMPECPICLEAAEDAVLTPCAHCMCRECLLASWASGAGGLCPICRQFMSRHDIITAPRGSRFRIDIEKNWTESSKVSALMRELDALRRKGEKSIVFSQWTTFLDLLQIPLNRQRHKFVRLDGSISQSQRERVIKDFSNDPKILIMLISLKAGGVGINLTAASNVFLLDPWWNPAVEEQAIMRIHRIGQTKKVSVKRFITKDSVEERMQQVQARKQRMIAGALTDQEIRTARIEELKMLFR
ncbi:hypothetical protein KP509_23G052300 [Ceratopteris richardii]|nr:hypothetical protein KP509_23G052300 [Ceratopteris richardii]